MNFSWLGTACDIIILIGAVLLAFDRIVKPIKFFGKKTSNSIEEKIVKILIEKMPEILLNHDKETRDKYLADRERYLQEIKKEVLSDIKKELTQVELLQQQYEVLVISAKDVLRAKIMHIYDENVKTKKIHLSDKEALDQYYIDYKALKGNSYIDKYYGRVKKWEVIDDDYNEEE